MLVNQGLPNGAVSFEHLADQTRARRGEGPRKCAHGYWRHQHDPCPKCWGIHEGRNDDVVPHQGPGNGWMLRRGEPACLGCGGPANAGYGLLPPGMKPGSPEYEAWRQRPKKCYGCSREDPSPAPGWESVQAPRELNPGPGVVLPPMTFDPGRERF